MLGSKERKEGGLLGGGDTKMNEYLGSLKGPRRGPGLWVQHLNLRGCQCSIKSWSEERKKNGKKIAAQLQTVSEFELKPVFSSNLR